jgi:hypothetical protein
MKRATGGAATTNTANRRRVEPDLRKIGWNLTALLRFIDRRRAMLDHRAVVKSGADFSKAPADRSRRKLLDVLHAHDGGTLGELCEHPNMTRWGVTQHLDLLEVANLVATTIREG